MELTVTLNCNVAGIKILFLVHLPRFLKISFLNPNFYRFHVPTRQGHHLHLQAPDLPALRRVQQGRVRAYWRPGMDTNHFSFYLLFHFRKIEDEPRHRAWGKFHNKLLTGYSDLPPSWGLKSLKTERSQYQSSVKSNGHCSFRGLFPPGPFSSELKKAR